MKELSTRALKKLAKLENILSAEGSYKNYRARIHTVNPPCIPYLGVYLLDLTYIEDGNPNKVEGLINFAKRRLIHNIIREVQQYQDKPFNFRRVDEIQSSITKAMSLRYRESYVNKNQNANVMASKSVVNIVARLSDEELANLPTMKDYETVLFNLSLEREPRGAERSQIP